MDVDASERICSQYRECDEQRPHFHFKVKDGERIMFIDGTRHPGCDYNAALIDGDRLQQAGIEGGDLLFCNECGWMSRPSHLEPGEPNE